MKSRPPVFEQKIKLEKGLFMAYRLVRKSMKLSKISTSYIWQEHIPRYPVIHFCSLFAP